MQTIKIVNFRTIREDEFYLYPYMVFVGKNNAGKSNLMKALDVFFGRTPTKEDFRLEGSTRTDHFSVTVTFVDLSQKELELYRGKTRYPNTPKEQLTLKIEVSRKPKIVTRYKFAHSQLILSTPAAKNRYGFLYNPKLTSKTKFKADPDTPSDFIDLIEAYSNQKVSSRGSIRLNSADFDIIKKNYIQSHPELNQIPTTLAFSDLGFSKSQLKSCLGTYFFIPAVQDIDEETTYKARGKTRINYLMDYLLDQMRDIHEEEEQNLKIKQIMDDIYKLQNEKSALNEMKTELNQTLSKFDGSTVRFATEPPSINKLVRDSLKIYMDDGVETYVSDKGHGLQRYFMVSLFKLWGDTLLKQQNVQEKSENSQKNPKVKKCNSVFFAIEEPELFLHPQYQLLMRDYLTKIAHTDHHQVLLNTHSPNFIDFNQYHTVVKVLKERKGQHLETRTLQPVIEEKGELIINDIIHAHGKNREKFHDVNEINLSYYMNPNRSQLFFADTVVLVEGETEKIMFQKWAKYFFPQETEKRFTTTYVDCNGKFNMQLYQEMLNGFHIPYVVIIDDDQYSGDTSMEITNHFIKKLAEEENSHLIMLDGDFENEFEITGHEMGTHGKKFKPYQAFKKYYEMDQTPKVEELEKLRTHPKLQQIFYSIYQKSMKSK